MLKGLLKRWRNKETQLNVFSKYRKTALNENWQQENVRICIWHTIGNTRAPPSSVGSFWKVMSFHYSKCKHSMVVKKFNANLRDPHKTIRPQLRKRCWQQGISCWLVWKVLGRASHVQSWSAVHLTHLHAFCIHWCLIMFTIMLCFSLFSMFYLQPHVLHFFKCR